MIRFCYLFTLLLMACTGVSKESSNDTGTAVQAAADAEANEITILIIYVTGDGGLGSMLSGALEGQAGSVTIRY